MLNELKEKIKKANLAYRKGDPIISDTEYDLLVEKLEEISPNDELLSEIGIQIDSSRKEKLPIEMASMNKIKSGKALNKWVELKNINTSEKVVLTPKYDGLSLCDKEADMKAWTRGDGTYGQKSDKHYKLINNNNKTGVFDYTYGEVVMSKKTFNEKYSDVFANPRNLVAGLLNKKEPSESLKDCDFMRYGAIGGNFSTKSEILDQLNKTQTIKVPYYICKVSELTEYLLIDLFKKWSIDYEIDGIIIELDDLKLRDKLGRETSTNNPKWARAFKHHSFEQTALTEVTGISWNISKKGLLKPIIHINPVLLDGVTVSNVTGNNARFVKEMGIGVGAKIEVKRSGMVIPLIVRVLEKVDFEMPKIENVDIIWNSAGIELMTTTETDDQKLKKIIAFFEILEADNVSEGVIKQLWEAGFKSIKDILKLTEKDFIKLDRFGERKSEIVYNSLKNSITDVPLNKLMHATGIFDGLGSKKLALLQHFKEKPSIEEVKEIDGFAEKSAKVFVEYYDEFFDFIKDLPISIKIEDKEDKVISNRLQGFGFVFTGVRRKDLNEKIELLGGEVKSSVSSKCTHLIMKKRGSGSSKEKKALELGLEILEVEELEEMLN